MKQTLKVNCEKEYLIEISDNSFEKLNQEINEATKGQKRLIVISKKVYKLYYTRLNFSEDEKIKDEVNFSEGEKTSLFVKNPELVKVSDSVK